MFIPRHPVVENQFCSYASSSVATGVGGVVCYAGSVVYLLANAANQEPIVEKLDAAGAVAFGFAMQKVKTGYHQVHPTGFSMPGDLGSSDVIAQPSYNANGAIDGTKEVPVGIAHLGIWDTVHYTAVMSGGVVQNVIAPGVALCASVDEAKVTTDTAAGTTAADGDAATTEVVARVVKGVSVAKAQANINNTTLYPIRIKLLV